MVADQVSIIVAGTPGQGPWVAGMQALLLKHGYLVGAVPDNHLTLTTIYSGELPLADGK